MRVMGSGLAWPAYRSTWGSTADGRAKQARALAAALVGPISHVSSPRGNRLLSQPAKFSATRFKQPTTRDA